MSLLAARRRAFTTFAAVTLTLLLAGVLAALLSRPAAAHADPYPPTQPTTSPSTSSSPPSSAPSSAPCVDAKPGSQAGSKPGAEQAAKPGSAPSGLCAAVSTMRAKPAATTTHPTSKSHDAQAVVRADGGSSSGLAQTGFQTLTATLIALALLGGGVLLVVLGRRRGSARRS